MQLSSRKERESIINICMYFVSDHFKMGDFSPQYSYVFKVGHSLKDLPIRLSLTDLQKFMEISHTN